MTQKYVQLTQDIQYTRRQLQSWKQKYLLAEQQLQTVQQDNKQLKKTIERLQDTNSKLVQTNRQLSEQKDSIVTDYSSEMSSIKEEIAQKQKQIIELRQIASPTMINQDLTIRQLKFQLNDQYQKETASKNRKIEELTQLNERMSYEKEIDKEKFNLKINVLEKEIKDLKSKHQIQIQDYSTRLFQLSQNKPPEERQILRRAKKENQELKRRLDLATQDLSSALQQKNQVHQDYRKWMKDHQKQIQGHHEQIVTYKEENARLTQMLQKASSKHDDFIIKERDRVIKKLKGDLEEMRDEIISKDKKISSLEVEQSKLQSDLQLVKNDQEKAVAKIEEADSWEIQRLQRELKEARTALQKARGHNVQLNDRIHEVNRTTIDTKRRFQQIRINVKEEQIRNQLKRQTSEQLLNSRVNDNRQEPVSHNEEDQKMLEDALRGEKGKLRDFLAKYIDLKKKYGHLENKLKKANEKIVQLLRDKIVLNSPKATGKHFEFPTEPHTRVSPPPRSPKHHFPTHSNHHMRSQPLHNLLEDTVINSQSDQHFMTTAEFRQGHNHDDPHSKTGPVINRQYLSPQDHRYIRVDDQQQESNDMSYYEKSLKMKNMRFKELRCTNHSHQKECEE